MCLFILLIIIVLIIRSDRIGKLVSLQIQSKSFQKGEYISLPPSVYPKFGEFYSTEINMLSILPNNTDIYSHKISFSFENFEFSTPYILIFEDQEDDNVRMLVAINFHFTNDENKIHDVTFNKRYIGFKKEDNMIDELLIKVDYHWKKVSLLETKNSLTMIYVFSCICIFFSIAILSISNALAKI